MVVVDSSDLSAPGFGSPARQTGQTGQTGTDALGGANLPRSGRSSAELSATVVRASPRFGGNGDRAVDLGQMLAKPALWWTIAVVWGIGLVRVVLIDPLHSRFALFFPDSWDYFDKAKVSIVSPGRLLTTRPPLYPYFVSLFGRNVIAVLIGQSVLYVVAWIGLATVVRRLMPGRVLPLLSACLLLAMGASPTFASWMSLPLTESLSCTLVVAGMAVWLQWASKPTRGWAIAGIFFGVLGGLLRDSTATLNLFVGGLLVAVFCVLAVARKRQRQRQRQRQRHVSRVLLAAALVWIAIGGYALVSQQHTGRARYSFYDVTGQRILPSASKLKWFVDRGMPLTPALQNRTGKTAWDDNWFFVNDPSLQSYRRWAQTNGNRLLATYIATHPGEAVSELRDYLNVSFVAPLRDYDRHAVYERLGPDAIGPLVKVQRLTMPHTNKPAWLLVLFGLISAAVSSIWGSVVSRRMARVVLLLGFSGLLSLFLEFHADSLEISRHLVSAFLRVRLFGLLGVFCGLVLLVETMSKRSRRFGALLDRVRTGQGWGQSETQGNSGGHAIDQPNRSLFRENKRAIGESSSFDDDTLWRNPDHEFVSVESALIWSEPVALDANGTGTADGTETADRTATTDTADRTETADITETADRTITGVRSNPVGDFSDELTARHSASLRWTETQADRAETVLCGDVITIPAWARRPLHWAVRSGWFLVIWLVSKPLGARSIAARAGVVETDAWAMRARQFSSSFVHSPSPLFTLLQRLCDLVGRVVFGKPAGSVDLLLLVLSVLYAVATWRAVRAVRSVARSREYQIIGALTVCIIALETRHVLWAGLALPDSLRLSLMIIVMAELILVRSLEQVRLSSWLGPIALLLILSGGPVPWAIAFVASLLVWQSVRTKTDWFGPFAFTVFAFGFGILQRVWNVEKASQRAGFAATFDAMGQSISQRFTDFDLWGVRFRANLRATDVIGSIVRGAWPTGIGFRLLWPILAIGVAGRLIIDRKRPVGMSVIAVSLVAYVIATWTFAPMGQAQRSFVPMFFCVALFAIAGLVGALTEVPGVPVLPISHAKGFAAASGLSRLSGSPGSIPVGTGQQWFSRLSNIVTGLLLSLVTIASLKSNELRARDYDAIPLMDTAHRINRLGGTYFTTASDVKGPFFQLVYHIASLLGGRRDAWWVISVLIIFTSAGTALAVAVIVWSRSRSRLAPTLIGVGLYIYLVSSKEAFAGILYSRNLTTFLAATAMALIATTRSTQDLRRPMWAGILLGIGVSTITAEIFTVIVAALWLWYRFPANVFPKEATGADEVSATRNLSNLHAPGSDSSGLNVTGGQNSAGGHSVSGGRRDSSSETFLDSWTDRTAVLSLSSESRLRDLFLRSACFVRDAFRELPRPLFRFVCSVLVSFSVPSLWYLVRGVFHEYWYYWYRYAGFYFTSTHRSLPKVMEHGVDEFRAYYLREPALGIVALAFVVFVVVGRSRQRSARRLELAIVGWWIASSLSITFAQRFSWHHFVVVIAPLFAMMGCVLDRFFAEQFVVSSTDNDNPSQDTERHIKQENKSIKGADWVRPPVAFVALLATVVFLSYGSWANVWRGWGDARNFKGFAEFNRSYLDSLGGDTRTVRALSELVSGPEETIFVWTNQPWNAATFGRMPASRFIENRVMKGYLYLGGLSPEYVPPHGWEQLQTDLERTKPALFVDNLDDPLPESPLKQYRAAHYQSFVQIDKWTVFMRNERAKTFLNPTPSTKGDISTCYEIRGTVLNPGPTSVQGLTFITNDLTRPTDSFFIRISGADIVAAFKGKNGEFPQYLNPIALASGTPVRLLVGRRAIALVANDSVKSIMLRPSESVSVILGSSDKGVQLKDVATVARPDCFGVSE